MKFACHRIENILGKGENPGYQHFLLFPEWSQDISPSGLLNVDVLWLRDHSSQQQHFRLLNI